MQKQIQQQIERLRAKGATYVDTRWYPYEKAEYLTLWNGNLKNAAATSESGVGIRVLYQGAWGFSASSDLADLTGLYDKAFDNARAAAERVTFPGPRRTRSRRSLPARARLTRSRSRSLKKSLS